MDPVSETDSKNEKLILEENQEEKENISNKQDTSNSEDNSKSESNTSSSTDSESDSDKDENRIQRKNRLSQIFKKRDSKQMLLDRMGSKVDSLKNSDLLNILVNLEENDESTEKKKVEILEDARVTKLTLSRIKVLDQGITAFGLICIALGVLEYQIEFSFDDRSEEKNQQMLYPLLNMNLIASVGMAILNIIRRILIFRFKKLRKKFNRRETQWNMGITLGLMAQTLLIMIIPYKFLINKKFVHGNSAINSEIYYYWNDLLNLFQLTKIYQIVRAYLTSSYFASNRAHRVCDMYQLQWNQMFVMRCLFEEYPYKFVIYSFTIGLIFFAFCIRVMEAPLSRNVNDMSHWPYSSCVWETVITMTTVGFGDYFPRTNMGRFVMLFCCMYGTVVVSLMVVLMTNELEMDVKEKKASIILDKLDIRGKMRQEAAWIIGGLGKLFHISKLSESEKKNLRARFSHHLHNFKVLRR